MLATKRSCLVSSPCTSASPSPSPSRRGSTLSYASFETEAQSVRRRVSFQTDFTDESFYSIDSEPATRHQLVRGERVRTAIPLATPSKHEVPEGSTGRVTRTEVSGEPGVVEVTLDDNTCLLAEPSDLISLGGLRRGQRIRLAKHMRLTADDNDELRMAPGALGWVTRDVAVGCPVPVEFDMGPRFEADPTAIVPEGHGKAPLAVRLRGALRFSSRRA